MRLKFVLLFLLAFGKLPAARIAIVESQSYTSAHNMDAMWHYVVSPLGHTVAIHPQTLLDNTDFFSSTDILIVSSGLIELPDHRVNTLLAFIRQGGNIYLQGEHRCDLSTNRAFETIVNSLGATFSWIDSTAGNLEPMYVLGRLATASYPTQLPLRFFWHGCYGSGCGVKAFLAHNKKLEYGFYFHSPDPSLGRLFISTDQDWIREAAVYGGFILMKNILSFLADPRDLTPTLIQPGILGPDTTLCVDEYVLDGGRIGLHTWSNGSTSLNTVVQVPGTYWVRIKAWDCFYSDTITLTRGGQFEPVLPDTLAGCAGDTLLADAGNSETIFGWSTGATNQTVSITEPGLYTVQLIDRWGCSKMDTVTTVFYPVYQDTIATQIPEGETYVLPDGEAVTEAGEYAHVFQTVRGCDSTIVILLKVIPQAEDSCCTLVLYNAFSPGGDGINDTWQLHGDTYRVATFDLRIFNRWGELLFHTTDPFFAWDGKKGVQLFPAGTYFYRAVARFTDGTAFEKKGMLTLMR